jgi:hypothetical protein
MLWKKLTINDINIIVRTVHCLKLVYYTWVFYSWPYSRVELTAHNYTDTANPNLSVWWSSKLKASARKCRVLNVRYFRQWTMTITHVLLVQQADISVPLWWHTDTYMANISTAAERITDSVPGQEMLRSALHCIKYPTEGEWQECRIACLEPRYWDLDVF